MYLQKIDYIITYFVKYWLHEYSRFKPQSALFVLLNYYCSLMTIDSD